jgi:hypothetical protein
MALADVPDPSKCDMTPAEALGGVIVCPGTPAPIPSSINTITVRNQSNTPIANASVVVQFTALTNICAGAVLTGTTNGSGVCTITLRAGGCADGVPSACVVKANGVTIFNFSNSKSPDYDGASGNGSVNLPDLIRFSSEFLGQTAPTCHDFDNDNDCDVADLVVFGTPFINANTCP